MFTVTIKQTVMGSEINETELAAQIKKMLETNENDARFLLKAASEKPNLLQKARTALKFL